jgi:hypothetical protein
MFVVIKSGCVDTYVDYPVCLFLGLFGLFGLFGLVGQCRLSCMFVVITSGAGWPLLYSALGGFKDEGMVV